MRSEDELKQIAVDLHSGKIFTSLDLKDESLLSMVFMPLIFMTEDQRKKYKDEKVIAFYEYYDQALPRGINGYPIFLSCRPLIKEELDIIIKFYDKIKEAISSIQISNC